MHRRTKKTFMVVALLVMVMMIAACAPSPGKVTRENYDKLSLGMTFDAVTEILGTPPYHSTRFGIQEYTWAEGERHIHAKFLAGRAVYYSSKGLEATAPEAAVAASGD